MEILRVAVPSGKQCNQLTTDNGNKYYFNDEGKINDNLFIVSANPLAVVDEAAKNDLGVIDGAGNIIIPMDKKELQKIAGVDDYLLVVESNPTDPKVVDAISKQNDPGFRPQIANEMSEIEAQIMAEMNRDGQSSKILFSDSYSQASLYDLSGNKIPGTDCSFVGQNDTAIYFHDNVKGSASQKMKVATTPVQKEENPVSEQPQIPVEAPQEEPNNDLESSINEETNTNIEFDNNIENTIPEEQPQIPNFDQNVNMNADGSFDIGGNEDFSNNEMFNYDQSMESDASAEINKEDSLEEENNSDIIPNNFFEQMQQNDQEKTEKEEKHRYSFEKEEEEEPEEFDTYVEPEEPDALIGDAIEKFEESFSVVENLKKVIDKRDEKYNKMVDEYEKKIAKNDAEHAKEVEELNYKYDTDMAKLKNHGANWQSRYQRANARAEVLDEEGKKKSDTIEKLREQLRETYEEVSKLKTEQEDLTTKYENVKEELKTEKKMHTEETERADNLQEENNRLIKGRSKLIENMRNMTRQINSVQELVKGVAPDVGKVEEPKVEDYDDKPLDNETFKEDNLVDFSLGDSLTSIPVALQEDENYSFNKIA